MIIVRSSKVVLLGALIAVAACADGGAAGPRLGRKADAIQAGKDDTTSTFAVAVLEDTGGVCSGTLIAPNLVLTARHCVADDDGGDSVDCAADKFAAPRAASGFRVTTDAEAVFDTAQYQATKIIVPSSTAFCGNDIALVVLTAKIPVTAATPAINPPLTNRAKYGSKLTAIGYGVTSPTKQDDGFRRKLAAVPIECIPGDATLGCTPEDFLMVAEELAAGNGLCSGDSGSGAYEPSSASAGKPIVIGVLSRAAESLGQCTDAVYTRTDTASAFLIAGAKDAAAIGMYAVPSWADPNAIEPDAGAPDGGTGPDPGTEPDPNPVAAPPSGTETTTTSGCSLGGARSAGKGNAGGGAGIAILGLAALVSARRRSRRL